MYEQVLSHVDASDETRREAEHKLLIYRYKYLEALPNPAARMVGPRNTAAKKEVAESDQAQMKEKEEALEAVRILASGIVAINVPDELAWNTSLEWQNHFSLTELKKHEVRAYIHHFPRSGLSFSFKALLFTLEDEQFIKEEKERFEAQDIDLAKPDPLLLAIAGVEESPQSVLAHCIASCLYLRDRDWLSCSELATNGLGVAKKLEVTFAIDLKLVKANLECNLASALTHLHPPQHHTRALRLADSVLSCAPYSTDAILCKAYIAQRASRWDQACKLFATVRDMKADTSLLSSRSEKDSQHLSISQDPAREARHEVAWCNVKLGRLEEGRDQLREVISDLDTLPNVNSEDQAKAWWRMGSCLWEMGGQYREETSEAFTCFITALKRDSSFAPAFTSLGLYYSTVSNPIDSARATKCFQKAFELDASENEAAHRLAQSYANDNDWDLVYLVAQRTIEGEGGELALRGEITSQRRHITRNAWAWTAIGSTELIRENYEKAIVAFQVALRSFVDDGNIWMRLGEAYTASGRLTAGIKTFEKSLDLFQGTDQEWQPLFSIANVERQQGKFNEALERLENLCKKEQSRLEIKIACAETRVSLALDEIRQGYLERGRKSVILAMTEAKEVLQKNDKILSAWKVLADGFFHCNHFRFEVEDAMMGELIESCAQYTVDVSLPSISAVTLSKLKTMSNIKTLLCSVYLNKLRVLLHHHDEQVAGSAWMDLTIGLHQLMMEQANQQQDEEAKESQAQAIACAKEALKMEPGNGTYWNAMGDLVFKTSVKLAQHCYIKAIESDTKSASSWTNLGLLYLQNEDVTLAKECFVKAQTIDSDHVQAWIGQAMVAKVQGNNKACRSLYHHAYAVEQELELEAIYGFASSLFQAMSTGENVAPLQIYTASFALSSYLSQRPRDVSALHLSALFAERIDELETAMEQIELASSILEEQYEQDESAEKARLFAICMVNLGRIQLGVGDFARARDAFDMGLGLLSAEEDREKDDYEKQANTTLQLKDVDLKRAQMGAHSGGGLAQFALGKRQEAGEALRIALEEVSPNDKNNKEQLHLLLAKILWENGEREEAESQIMEALSIHPKSISALLSLGSISVLNKDQEQFQLVSEELRELISMDESGQVSSFLASTYVADGRTEEAISMLNYLLEDSSSAAAAITIQQQYITLLLQFFISTLLEKTTQKAMDSQNDYLQRAKEAAQSLLQKIQNNLSEFGQDNLVSTLRLTAIVMALKESKKESLELAMRLVTLDPANISLWRLLQTIRNHHYTTISDD